LDYAQARYYAFKAGRFTTVDPLTSSSTVNNPQTMNRYSYALNSPYKYVDPSGMDSSEVDAAFAQLGALVENAEAARMAEEEARREAEKREAQQQSNASANSHEALHQQTGPENSQQGQAPTQRRSVALAELGHDGNAFDARALKSADSQSEVGYFNNGEEIISQLQLLSASGAPIDRVAIHSHGFTCGVMGTDLNTGLYIGWEAHPARTRAASYNLLPGRNSDLPAGAATTTELTSAIAGSSPSIKIATGGTIVFFGCNSIALASHLSAELGQAGRGDIKVVGASSQVSEKNGKPRIDRGATWQTYQAGKMIDQTREMRYK
jgi:hypothetical protein